MKYGNIQQLSDAVEALEAVSGKSATEEATFVVSQVQPLTSRIAQLEKDLADAKARLVELVGAPAKP